MSNPSVAAVGYLNMLPYFFDRSDIRLFSTPAQLNDAIRCGEVDAACTSAIASLQTDFLPIFPMLGVGSQREVGSVFLEPFFFDDEHQMFWKDFWSRPRLKKSIDLTIVTSGASEQSLWLAQLFFSWKGYQTSIYKVQQSEAFSLTSTNFTDLRKSFSSDYAVYLSIGDVALIRYFKNIFVNTKRLRWDVATLWRSFQNLPCAFAFWTAKPTLDEQVRKKIYSESCASIERWQNLAPTERYHFVLNFLRQKNDPLYLVLSEGAYSYEVERYFGNLDFVFSTSYSQVYEKYKEFYSLKIRNC